MGRSSPVMGGLAAVLLLLPACSSEGDQVPLAMTRTDTAGDLDCTNAGATLSVTTDELEFGPVAAEARVTTADRAAVQVWLADYPQPVPVPALDPDHPAPTDGHARIRLDLVRLDGQPIEFPATFPAAPGPGDHRALLVIETTTATHGQYLDIEGEATLLGLGGGGLCGYFDIGDDEQHAAGSFVIP